MINFDHITVKPNFQFSLEKNILMILSKHTDVKKETTYVPYKFYYLKQQRSIVGEE